MKKYFLFLLFPSLFFSCIPSKDVFYLQGEKSEETTIKRVNNVPYKLQIDDIVSIEIKSTNEELVSIFKKNTNGNNVGGVGGSGGQTNGAGYFNGYSVNAYGNIRIPTLGDVNVLGYTTIEVRKKIEKQLEQYIKQEENLFVSVKLFGIQYTILGEINNPGPRVIFQNKVSILEAIANSGDITDLGNRKEVEIFRNSISGIEKFIIDLTNIEAFNSEIFYLKPNDYIYIRPLKQKFWGTGVTGLQSLTTFVSIFTLITSTIIVARNL